MEIIDNGRDVRLKPKHQPFHVGWVKLSSTWIDRLEQSKSVGTYKLAHRILTEAFKREHIGGQIVLSRNVTRLPSTTTARAARELVQLGLIKIQQSGNKAIRVVNLLLR